MFKVNTRIKLLTALTATASMMPQYAPAGQPLLSFDEVIRNDQSLSLTESSAQSNRISGISKIFSDTPNDNNDKKVQLINSVGGVLNITTATRNINAVGMYASTGEGSRNRVSLINSGTVTITDTRNVGVTDQGFSTGMAAESNEGGANEFALQNDGLIQVQSTGRDGAAMGILVSGQSQDTGTLTDTSVIINNGDINVSSGSSYAWGVRQFSSNSALLGTIVNTGTITATSGATNTAYYPVLLRKSAVGILSDMNGSPGSILNVNNTGKIFVSASGDYGLAQGIFTKLAPINSPDAVYSTLENNGLVEVTTSGKNGISSGVSAGLVESLNMPLSSVITNEKNGIINATATGDEGKAYGVHATLSENVDITVANEGQINVSGDTAHQLYVTTVDSATSNTSGTAYIKTWNMDLYDRESGKQSMFAVDEKGKMRFGTKDGAGAHFILRPGSVAKGYEDNKHFNVKDMVHIYGNQATVEGYIGHVSTPLPLLKANSGLVDSAGQMRWDNQWVSLEVRPEEGDNNIIDSGVVDIFRNQAENIGQILATAKPPSAQASTNNDVELKIYYANNRRFGTGASVTDSVGTVAYANFDVSSHATFGWHGGFETAHLRARNGLLNIHALSGIFGLQGRYDFADNSYLRTQATGIISRNDNDFRTFDGDSAQRSTTNMGFYSAVIWGIDYAYNSENTFTPEAGLTMLLTQSPEISVRYKNGDDLNQNYDGQHYSEASAVAGVRWSGKHTINNNEIKPTFYAGVRQLLTDGKIKSGLNFMDEQYTTYIKNDKTIAVVDTGISTPVNPSFDIGINYRGAYSQHQINHVGYINGTIKF